MAIIHKLRQDESYSEVNAFYILWQVCPLNGAEWPSGTKQT